MKIKEGFERKKIGQHEMVYRTKEDGKMDLWFALNETGVFLWDHLLEGCSLSDLVEKMTQEYDAEAGEAEMIREDIQEYLEQLRSMGDLED